MSENLLEITDLSVSMPTPDGPWRALDRAGVYLERGETLGLVGESGSGKSTLARSIVRLLPRGSEVTGKVEFDGRPITNLSPRELQKLRSEDVSMIYQDPSAHVNPVRRVGDFLTEALTLTGRSSRGEARERCLATLEEIGLADGERLMGQYPHQLSGGLLQRIMIAAAVASDPKLLIADEPTTALDVTSQALVLAVLSQAVKDRGLAMLFITHDLDLAVAMCQRIAVLYAGRVVEVNSAERLVECAQHPYTAALLNARPSLYRTTAVKGVVGRPLGAQEAPSEECPFAPRCQYAVDACREARPPLEPVEGGVAACIRIAELSLGTDPVRSNA